jgi:hypothetical protein
MRCEYRRLRYQWGRYIPKYYCITQVHQHSMADDEISLFVRFGVIPLIVRVPCKPVHGFPGGHLLSVVVRGRLRVVPESDLWTILHIAHCRLGDGKQLSWKAHHTTLLIYPSIPCVNDDASCSLPHLFDFYDDIVVQSLVCRHVRCFDIVLPSNGVCFPMLEREAALGKKSWKCI